LITALLHSRDVWAAPDSTAEVDVDLVNVGETAATAHLEVIGAPAEIVVMPVLPDVIQPGETLHTRLAFAVPKTFSSGRHELVLRLAVGSETTDIPFRLSVLPLDNVALSINPSTIKGRIRSRFTVTLHNRSETAIDLSLAGSGDGVHLKFIPDQVRLRSGERTTTRARVWARPPILSTSVRRPLTVSAQGRSRPLTVTGAFAQKPLIGGFARRGAVIIALVGLAVAGVLLALSFLRGSSDDESSADTTTTTTAGTGDDDAAGTTGDGTGSSGEDDDRVSARGTVMLADESTPDGIKVTLRSISLDDPANAATPAAQPTVNRSAAKKFAFVTDAIRARQGSAGPITVVTEPNGLWTHTQLVPGANYEIAFEKPGYTTQAFVVSPVAGEELADLEVTLIPGTGALGGVVRGPGGPLGGANVTVTDGSLTYTATTSTLEGQVGRWDIEGLGTPARYIVTVERRGHGAVVRSVDLGPGERIDDIATVLVSGVGSITNGQVNSAGQGVGGISVTATAADFSLTTTTLSETDGDAGRFDLPQLPLGVNYVLTIEGDGWLTQTLEVTVNGSVTGIVINLLPETGTLSGLVTDNTDNSLDGVTVTAVGETLSFRTTTSAGNYRFGSLPPGDYVVTFEQFEHLPAAFPATVRAGAPTVLDASLMFAPNTVPTANATLSGVLTNQKGVVVNDATITIVGHDPPLSVTQAGADGFFQITGVNFGAYTILVESPTHQTLRGFRSFGLDQTVDFSETLFTFGAFQGIVSDLATKAPIWQATIDISGGAPTILTTDAGGAYNEVDFFSPGDYTLTVSAQGYLPQTKTSTIPLGSPTPTVVDFELERRPSIIVNVVGADDGAFSVLTDATVSFTTTPTGYLGDASLSVDSGGVARFEELPRNSLTPGNPPIAGPEVPKLQPGTYLVSASAPGYDTSSAIAVVVGIGEAKTVTIGLTGAAGGAGQLASGTVSYQRDGVDAPVVGASVTANVITGYTPISPAADPAPVFGPVAETTDAAGFWAAPQHRDGAATYSFAHPAFDPDTLQIDVSPSAPPLSGDITLSPRPSSITGTVTLATSSGLDPSRFEVIATPSVGAALPAVTVDPNGTFSIPITSPGTWNVVVQDSVGNDGHFDGVPASAGLQVEPNSTAPFPFVVAVTERATVIVDVTPDSATAQLCTNGGTACAPAVSPVGGFVTFDDVVPGVAYTVIAQAPLHEDATVAVGTPGPGDIVNLAAAPARWGTISGFVDGRIGTVTPVDSPLDGVTVSASFGGATYTGITTVNGTFSIDAPPLLVGQTYTLTFDRTFYTNIPVSPPSPIVSPAPLGTDTPLASRIVLAVEPVDLRITILDDAMVPITGANITLVDAGPTGEAALVATYPNPGPIVFSAVQPITWSYTVTAPGHNDTLGTIALPPGGTTNPFQIVVPRNTGSITGTVTARLADGTVIGVVQGVSVEHSIPGAVNTTTAADGTYTVDKTPNNAIGWPITYGKANYTDQTISVVVSDQSNPTTQDVALRPDDGTILLTVTADPVAVFANLSAQLERVLDSSGQGTSIGSLVPVQSNGTASFSVPPSLTAGVARTLHYRIVLSGTGFQTTTVDNLDLLPGGALTPSTTIAHVPPPPTFATSPAPLTTADGQFTVTWIPPATDGGSPITGYTVEWNINDNGWNNAVQVDGGPLTRTQTGLTAGDSIAVRVRAKNTIGAGAPSVELNATIPDVPDPVQPITLTPTANAEITVSWAAPADNGSAIIDYQVSYKRDQGGWGNDTRVNVGGTGTSLAVTASINVGTDYKFRVRARNGVSASSGWGPWGNEQSITALGDPTAPLNVAAAPADASITLSWDPPTADGGSAISDYFYQIDSGSGFGPEIGVGSAATSVVITNGIINGTSYTLRVRAMNSDLLGTLSATVSVTPAGSPGAPTGLTLTPGDTQLTAAWTAPTVDGGVAITDYEYRVDGGAAVSTGGTTPNIVITGLTNGTSYSVEVRARNANGLAGSWSTAASATPTA
jgi:large repetitive protein